MLIRTDGMELEVQGDFVYLQVREGLDVCKDEVELSPGALAVLNDITAGAVELIEKARAVLLPS